MKYLMAKKSKMAKIIKPTTIDSNIFAVLSFMCYTPISNIDNARPDNER